MSTHEHRALAACPVCGDRLVTTRLGCAGCGTEIVGQFAPCPYCALDDADLDLLKVFLVSRGNLKELQAHLGVSYPTARARFNDLLDRLGWLDEADADATPDVAPAPDADAASDADADAATDAEAESGTRDTPGASGAGGDEVRDQVLAQVAAGTLSPGVAADLLGRLGG